MLGATLVFVLESNRDEAPRLLVKEGALEKPTPGSTVDPGDSASVSFLTNKGSFTVSLATGTYPIATNNFAYLARSGFYDGLGFHRIVPGFVIQGGDPKGDGTGGPGYRAIDPPEPGTIYRPGTVAMAKGSDEARGSFGSQFFIVTASESIDLPADYAVVGRVISGLDVVAEIGRLGGEDEKPIETVVIERATLREGQ